ncbi:MAG TPA: hypothetical protein VFH73_22670 [Polyangia bacterium]|jgi:hypothetical protein|nr:hypothetical protein [Polyangia bacterium]
MNRWPTLSVSLAMGLGLGTCGSSNSGSDNCPRNGTVPADLRDVERAGEGLVSTTFGAYPDRKPSWENAATVNGLLNQVWGRLKTQCPGMPSASVQHMEQVVASLDTAIAMKNQQSAAYLANDVGLTVPALFDFFHPDAPKAVINMDAVYRQLGLDAHFGMPAKTRADLDSLHSDWSGAKAAVEMRVPRCHRVGGTATISGDIEQSLTNADAALVAGDTKVIEMESENGALEIDTLELLFDCPPDGVMPTKGLGAVCTDMSACGPGQVCAPYGVGQKRCAPAPETAKIGTPCTTTIDCGTDSRSACNNEAGDGYPGGYCFMEPCDDVNICPPGATCVALGGEASGCFQECMTDADCRTAEGYVCQLFVTTPPKGFGPTAQGCAFKCMRDPDCQSPLTCDLATGKCKP